MIVLTEFQCYAIGNMDGDGLWDGNYQWVETSEAFKTRDKDELDAMSQSLDYRGIDHVQLLITNIVKPTHDGWGVFQVIEEL